VDDKDYQAPFRFTGKLAKLTVKVAPPKLTADNVKALEKTLREKD